MFVICCSKNHFIFVHVIDQRASCLFSLVCSHVHERGGKCLTAFLCMGCFLKGIGNQQPWLLDRRGRREFAVGKKQRSPVHLTFNTTSYSPFKKKEPVKFFLEFKMFLGFE